MRIKNRFVGFALGAVVGEVVTVCVYVLFAIVCFIIKEPRGLNDLDPFVFGLYAVLFIAPIVGGVLSVRMVHRRIAAATVDTK